MGLLLFILLPNGARAERLFHDGLEFGTSVSTAYQSGYSGTLGSPAVDATSLRSGSYGLHIASMSSGAGEGFRWRQVNSGATTGHWYVRGYLYIVSAPGVNDSTILAIAGATSQTSPVSGIKLNDDRTLTLNDEDGVVGTSAVALATNTWYRIEMEVDNTAAAGSHTVTLRVDGTNVVSATNRSIATTLTGFRIGGNINNESNTTGEWYWDDIALNNDSGSYQTSWPGSGKIVHMEVDSDGTTTNRGSQGTNWETGPSTGGTAYQQLDESPTANDATDYITLITNSTAVDSGTGVMLFNLESSSSAGIGASDTITLAAVRARMAGAATGNFVYRQIIKSGASYLDNAVTFQNTTGWYWDYYLEPRFSVAIAYTDPATGSAWTTSGLDAAEVGVRATDADPDVQISKIILQVEYVPSAGPTGGGPTGVGVRKVINMVRFIISGGRMIIR